MDIPPLSKKWKVIIVEDNDTYRKIVKNAMSIAGFNMLEAENGLRGLEIIRTEHPDLVLSDIYMPVMDGMSMLQELKKDDQIMHIPVVILTNIQEELENAVKHGAEEALLKSSLTPPQLVEVCRKYLEGNGNHASS